MKSYHTFRPALLGITLLAVSSLTFASTFIITDDELDAEIFPQVAESIRVNLDGPNAPAGLTASRKQQALRSLERIERYLAEDSHRNVNKIRNEQIRVNAALAPTVARNDNKSEVICRRVKKVGTNIPTTECRTRAEMEAAEQAAHEEIHRLRQLQSLKD